MGRDSRTPNKTLHFNMIVVMVIKIPMLMVIIMVVEITMEGCGSSDRKCTQIATKKCVEAFFVEDIV